MIGDFDRNLEEKYERIARSDITTFDKPCDHCELSEKCPHCPRGEDECNIPSYAMKEFGSCYIPAGIARVECGTKSVTEGIGEDYKIDPDYYRSNMKYDCEINVRKWEPAQPVFISAQTGSGKNYFVEKTLIPYLKKLNQENRVNFKILIISNRLALKKQIENHMYDNYNTYDIYAYSKCDDECAYVITYQGLLRMEQMLKQQQKQKGEQYIYVICDEAHFFTSDAMFNPHTSRILSSITSIFKNSIRVYMSATPYECLNHIYEHEGMRLNNAIEELEQFQMAFYHFDRDYTYLNIKAYSQIDELYDIIINSVDKKEKWLICVDNKTKCASIKSNLIKLSTEKASVEDNTSSSEQKSIAEKILVVDASSKKDEKFISLLENEKFDKGTNVLISTSVLDNGVNLNNIDNIVISDTNMTKCIQFVGRARARGNAKNLHIKRFDDKQIKSMILDYEAYQDAYHSFDLAYDSNSSVDHVYKFLARYYDNQEKDWRIARLLFGRSFDTPNKLYINEIARSLVNMRIDMYRLILEEMKREGSEAESDRVHVGQGYLEYQISWFGKVYCEDNDVTFKDTEKAKAALFSFLKSCSTDGALFETEKQTSNRSAKVNNKDDDRVYGDQDEFKKEFTALYDAAYGREDRNNSRYYDPKKISKLLKKTNLPFEIKSNHGWTVIECEKDDKN